MSISLGSYRTYFRITCSLNCFGWVINVSYFRQFALGGFYGLLQSNTALQADAHTSGSIKCKMSLGGVHLKVVAPELSAVSPL